ncbi:hypothetical protein [Pseudochryseolinea flava]|nr:hypothetical protein [Pseudochryseolinea flava]
MSRAKFLTMLALMFSSCSGVTRLDSDDFTDVDSRIDILEKEVRVFSEIHDAEFELFNVNGFQSQRQGFTIPGASSGDYKFVVKVDTADIKKWTEGMVKLDLNHDDDSWTKEIVSARAEHWKTTCEPSYYGRQGDDVELVLFRENGIIFKRIIIN